MHVVEDYLNALHRTSAADVDTVCKGLSGFKLQKFHSSQRFPWDGLKLSHARMRPGSNLGLPRVTSRLFARAPERVAYWVSGGFPFSICMCIPPCGATPKL
jgi:hypothetical protein